MVRYVSFIVVICLFFGCSNDKSGNEKAFYYWKTSYRFSEKDRTMMQKMSVDKFYLRFFDVKIDRISGKAIPVGKLRIRKGEIYHKNYVPCVFIDNNVIKKLSEDKLTTLARNIVIEVKSIAKKIALEIDKNDTISTNYYRELQIDCDWSAKSKEKYFFFIKTLKKIVDNTNISVTLRLWQLKNKKLAGIPPADRAMLMCYSTGNPRNYFIDNSLANYEEIEKYVKGQTYPLQLDVALPIYSWAILFRNRDFKKIVRNFNFKDADSDTALFKHLRKNRYFIKKDTVLFDYFLRYGDELRLESFDKTEMQKLIKLLKREKLKLDNSVVSFFSWDSIYIKNHGYEEINKYYSDFINR